MKAAIAFAVVRRVYRSGWEVLSITTENRHRVFGRDGDQRTTNRATRDILARFDTEAEAIAAAMAAQEAWNGQARAVSDAEKALGRAKADREEAVMLALAAAATRARLQAEQSPVQTVAPSHGRTSAACDMPA